MIMDIDLVVGIGMCLVLFSHLLYLWHFTMALYHGSIYRRQKFRTNQTAISACYHRRIDLFILKI